MCQALLLRRPIIDRGERRVFTSFSPCVLALRAVLVPRDRLSVHRPLFVKVKTLFGSIDIDPARGSS